YVRDPHVADILRGLMRSSMTVPLRGREGIIGALVFGTAAGGRRYGPADLALAEDLSRRAAMAIENAGLYQAAREAVQLRDEFLTVSSHELNTPITSLMLSLQSLVEDAG